LQNLLCSSTPKTQAQQGCPHIKEDAPRQWKGMASCIVVSSLRLCVNYLNVYVCGLWNGRGERWVFPPFPATTPSPVEAKFVQAQAQRWREELLECTAVAAPWGCLLDFARDENPLSTTFALDWALCA